MKKSIIYLGIALVSFANVCSASNSLRNDKRVLEQDSQENLGCQQEESLSFAKVSFGQKNFPAIADETVLYPETVMSVNSVNSIEQIIADNNRIIENNPTINQELFYIEKPIEEVIISNNQIIENNIDNTIRPLYLEKTIEDFIAEDNLIIESNISNEVFPLDFEKINKQSNTLKQVGSEKFVGMK